MKKKDPTVIKAVTPAATFVWPKLNEPDVKPEYNINHYVVTVRMTMKEAASLIKTLQPVMEIVVREGQEKFAALPVAARKKLGKLSINEFYSEVFDKETEEPTGEVEFKFKTGAEYPPALFDAKGKAIVRNKNTPTIGGGTIGKVSFSTKGYFVQATGTAGLSLYLGAAQIIELVEHGGQSFDGYGFSEEHGYTSTDDDDDAEVSTDEEDDLDEDIDF